MAKRAAIYVRISKDKTGAGLGVQRQEKDCRALAERLGWAISRVYVDNDISAYSGKPRPGYTELLADIDRGRIDGLVVWHTDRLHRTTAELEHYINVARDVPVQAVQAGHIDLSTPTGRAVAKTHGAWAQHEVELKRERQQSKNRQLAEAGLPIGGGRPFGFESDGITINPTEAQELRDMTDRVLAGESLASIIRDLNARGVTSVRGNQWRYSTLRSLLTRPRNAALSVHKGQVVGPAQWPSIVTEDAYRAVVRLLADPSRRTTTGNNRVHLLSGLAKCGKCGAGMKPGSVNARGQKYVMYRCCVHRSIPKVDEFVTRLTLMVLSDLRIQRALAKATQVDTTALDAERKAIEVKLRTYAEMLDNDEMTDDQFRTLTKKTRLRLSEIDAETDALHSRTVFGDLLTDDEDEMHRRWEALPLDRKRAIIDALMTVTINPVGRNGRGPQPVGKGVSVLFRQSGTGIVGGTMPKDLERRIVDLLTA